MNDRETYHECQCYPASKGYPASLRNGCSDPWVDCHVLSEIRALAKPGGREAAQVAYGAQVREAAEGRNKRPTAGDAARRLQGFGVPSAALWPLGSGKSTDALEAAQKWWPTRAQFPFLLLMGDVGLGKSVAAAWCASEWARDFPWNDLPGGPSREPFVWLDGPKLRSISAFDNDVAADAGRAQLLVVDDAGRDSNPRAMEILAEVLVERIDRKRATVLTTNLKGEPFRQRYGIALADRLRASAVIPRLQGKSMRGKS